MQMRYSYKPALFFLIAFAISWGCWFFSAQFSQQEGKEVESLLLNALGLIGGPALTAAMLIMVSDSPALKKDFWSRLLNPTRINLAYLGVLLILPPMIVYAGTLLSVQLGYSSDQFKFAGDPEQLIPMIIIAIIIAPTFEEIAWRGYGMDSLRAKLAPLSASLVFGVLWSLWHAPLVMIKGTYHYELLHMENPIYLVNFFVSVVVAAVFVNWIYYKNNRSILGNILAHAALNWWAISLQTEQITKCIITGIYIVVALAIILIDRKAFSGGPRDYVHDA